MLRSKVLFGLLVWAVMVASVGGGEFARNEKKSTDDPKDGRVAFERLKQLVGDWQHADTKEEGLKGKTIVRYRLTAAGSAVAETIFPGDEKEMISLYHLNGGQLEMTHYCCCGNQPRMRARTGDDKDELIFEFAGGTNLNPANDKHMHDYRVRFVAPDRLHGEWEFYVDGKAAGKHVFDLVRKSR
jgi:hypothetical protein